MTQIASKSIKIELTGNSSGCIMFFLVVTNGYRVGYFLFGGLREYISYREVHERIYINVLVNEQTNEIVMVLCQFTSLIE